MSAVIVILGVSSSPAAATDEPGLPSICRNEINAAVRMGADVSDLAEKGTLRLDGRTITVHGEGAQWRQVDRSDQTYVTRFHSMAWLVLAAQQGYPVVDLLLERENALLDPGSTASDLALKTTGWTEGAVRLRMGTVSCLYSWSGDERLVPIMERLVLAGADPFRYRGLPLKKVHNHGTLSNIMLAEVAEVFGRDEWWQLALRRFTSDFVRVFSTCGVSVEQSSSYQYLNYQLWQRSLRLLESVGNYHADSVREMLDRAALAAIQMTRPDGTLEAIGDGNERRQEELGADLDYDSADTKLWCPGRGWAANRSSWDDSMTHYVLRFGGRVAMHGHHDHGSATWFTQGVPVFADRGLYDKSRGSRYEWARSAAAHNTFEPVGLDTSGEMSVVDLSQDRTDAYRLKWQEGKTSLVRNLRIPLDARYITIDDTASTDDSTVLDQSPVIVPLTSFRATDLGKSRRGQRWAQNWQLSTEWMILSRAGLWDPLAYHPRTGLYLYGACWSGTFMSPSAREVEAYPAWREVVQATAFTCRQSGRLVHMDTLWVVAPVNGTFSWNRTTGAVTVTPTPAA